MARYVRDLKWSRGAQRPRAARTKRRRVNRGDPRPSKASVPVGMVEPAQQAPHRVQGGAREHTTEPCVMHAIPRIGSRPLTSPSHLSAAFRKKVPSPATDSSNGLEQRRDRENRTENQGLPDCEGFSIRYLRSNTNRQATNSPVRMSWIAERRRILGVKICSAAVRPVEEVG